MKILNWLRENKLLVVILFIGAFFRFYKIDFQSVWLDEIHTLNEADPKNSIAEIYDKLLIAEPHPPLYFLIVHFCFKIFGYTTFVLRSLSALIGLLGIFSIYLLGKEIFNKKVGLLASILLAINYFHIYYSQDGRMYGLLFLTTTLSFYYLIKFIKRSTLKNAIFYSFFSALMIYSHFFALFTLVAQYLILLYFVIKPFETNSKTFFRYCLISGITTLVLFIPSFGLLKKTREIKSFWIQMPTLDVYTQFFKDFFGQSEVVVVFIIILIMFFFINLLKEKNVENYNINPEKDKLIFSFFILILWIIITLILPLIRTYTSLPMLINRYFINIVPALIIIIAISLVLIKNQIIRNLILLIIVVFSVTNIFIVKKYYDQPNKSQFRELSAFVVKNNVNNEKVVSSLSWYFPYFFKRKEIFDSSLDNYVAQMIKDSTKTKSFWYMDAHNRPYNVSQETQRFLDENFYVENSFDGYDAWTKHYVKGRGIDINKQITSFGDLKEQNGTNIIYNIDKYVEKGNTVEVFGWSYFENQNTDNITIEIVLIENQKIIKTQTQKFIRQDVTNSSKNKLNLDNSGFLVNINKNNLPKGNYKLGIFIYDKINKKKGLAITKKTLNN